MNLTKPPGATNATGKYRLLVQYTEIMSPFFGNSTSYRFCPILADPPVFRNEVLTKLCPTQMHSPPAQIAHTCASYPPAHTASMHSANACSLVVHLVKIYLKNGGCFVSRVGRMVATLVRITESSISEDWLLEREKKADHV